MIDANLVGSYHGDQEKRDQMHDAQCLAGMAFSNALLGITHSMAHKTGAAYTGGHLIHGAANAMFLPKVIQFNAKDNVAAERYAVIADDLELGGSTVKEKVAKLVAYVRRLCDELNMPHAIQGYGASGLPARKGLSQRRNFWKSCLKLRPTPSVMPVLSPTPRQPTQEEMEKLLKCCYYDLEVDF